MKNGDYHLHSVVLIVITIFGIVCASAGYALRKHQERLELEAAWQQRDDYFVRAVRAEVALKGLRERCGDCR